MLRNLKNTFTAVAFVNIKCWNIFFLIGVVISGIRIETNVDVSEINKEKKDEGKGKN